MATMKAAVIREAGGPEVLRIETLPVPQPMAGWVLIQVKAFGLNRFELFTHQGLSLNVKFPPCTRHRGGWDRPGCSRGRVCEG